MTGAPPTPAPDAVAARATRLARLGAILIASVAFASAARFVVHQGAAREDTERRLRAGIARASAGLEAWEATALARARTWAADPTLESVRPDGTTTLVQAVRAAAPEGVRAAALFSPDGALLGSTAPTLLADATRS
ncbi:MAG: hypothetical protein K1X31_04135, partial [Gemmatimonadaceae bacterium]|nr:hypothetical protein [Gemmatimonadaceae bacterium]